MAKHEAEAPELDISPFTDSFKDMLSGMVEDITDPAFAELVAGLSQDYINIALLKANPEVSEELIEEAEETVRARALSLHRRADRLPAAGRRFPRAGDRRRGKAGGRGLGRPAPRPLMERRQTAPDLAHPSGFGIKGP